MSKVAKSAFRALGSLLALLSVGWIVYRFVQSGALDQVVASPHFDQILAMVCAAIPVYALGLCCAGLAWWCMQAAFLEKRPRVRPLFATYAVTQFAKYLPGNVGQYVGRHLLLRRLGMSHRALLLATLGEAGFLVLASLVWAASAVKTILPRFPFNPSNWQVLLLECCALSAAYVCLQWARTRNAKAKHWIPLHAPAWLLPALPLQLLLFAAMAIALMAPASLLLTNSTDIWLIPAAAAASWVTGFLVVGAPAGIGVREMVFLALLHGRMPETDILLLAAAFRLITFGGDIMILFLGLALGSNAVQTTGAAEH